MRIKNFLGMVADLTQEKSAGSRALGPAEQAVELRLTLPLVLIVTLIFTFCMTIFTAVHAAQAQSNSDIQALMQTHGGAIRKSSRKTIAPAIDALAASRLPQAQTVLERWQAKDMWTRKSDGLFVYASKIDSKTLEIFDFENGQSLGSVAKSDFRQIKPNSGIRAMIGSALVAFQLQAADPARRAEALDAIERKPDPSHLTALRGLATADPDATLAARKSRLVRLLTIRFDDDEDARLAAIDGFVGDLGVDLRAALNPLVETEIAFFKGALPIEADIARELTVGSDNLPRDAAYDLLVNADLAPSRQDLATQKQVLVANLENGTVAGMLVSQMSDQSARNSAYATLVAEGKAAPVASEADIDSILSEYVFFERFVAASPVIAFAAEAVLADIETRVQVGQFVDLGLDALSLGSIYFLAAIGLAITFGVMGVINMAHGEFIMMGAYTGYVIQLFVPDYTLSIVLAIPAAFVVTFVAGVALERTVIRWLYHRPLETLLATFGISIALQQLAKNIFGTQARPLTSPDWLGGAWVINDVVSISYIRIAIFVLALLFLGLFLFIMRRTRLGLEVRAVTQNRRMAANMGINPDRINMLTFGLGSGIAGVAGVAIGLYAKVTSEMGQDYIVQSFMTVVVGGVGNIWGALLGAGLIGFLQKGIEWFNPSNTLAAQTYMILFIILFIQIRPRGLIALKGRAVEG